MSSLDGTTGFRLDGVATNDESGSSVASAGDVNGDGFADVIIGAPGANGRAGSSYVVFGNGLGFASALPLSSLNGTNGFRLDGAVAGENSGRSVASAGDVNGDDFGDLIIGAPLADTYAAPRGASYVVFGKAGGFSASLDLSTLDGTNGFKLRGRAEYDHSGRQVASAGDINGDGFDDVVVTDVYYAYRSYIRQHTAYVVFGKAGGFPANIDLSSLNGSNGFTLVHGAGSDYLSSTPAASAGDVNGDGFGDLIAGHPAAEPHGRYSGISYVVFGKAGGFSASLDLFTLNGANGFKLRGVAAGDSSGSSVASAGDVNGDGFGDMTVGARNASYVVFGKAGSFASNLELSSLDGANGFKIDGAAGTRSVAAAGDVNGDGFDDVNIGGSVVVFGKTDGFPAVLQASSLNGANGFRITGGGGVTGLAGDADGDGFADLIIGAPGADPNGNRSGASYVVFGRAPDGPVTRTGSAAGQYISGGPFADRLSGLGGNDVVEGRGGGDTLNGGGATNTASYRHATAGVRADLRFPASNSGEALGDRYVAIQNLKGSQFGDTLLGNDLNNTLAGSDGNDALYARGGNDVLSGGLGADSKTGGSGADVFVLRRTNESPASAGRDTIRDFAPGIDKIDLRSIDADTTNAGDQPFTFIGTSAFSHEEGEVRVHQSGLSVIVSGDIDGDAQADFQMVLRNINNATVLTQTDFKL